MLALSAPCRSCGLHHDAAHPCPIALTLPERPQPPLVAGDLLAGRYRIERLLHRGPMSQVYRVADTARRNEPVVLKELLTSALPPGERAEAVGWFLREAHLLSRLRHPALPRLYASFASGDRQYLVMNEVPGISLEERARQQAPSEEQVLRWGIQICEVLHFLHTLPEPIVYRDLKPANVLVRYDSGTIALVDFGVAREIDPGRAGTAVGTPGYAAPEQYQGLADAGSDIYALGATLHRLLTGYDAEHEPPFRQPPVRALRPGVSAATAAAIDRALALDPNARQAAVEDLWAELHAALPARDAAIERVVGPFYRTTTLLPLFTVPATAALLYDRPVHTPAEWAVFFVLLLAPMLCYLRPVRALRARADALGGTACTDVRLAQGLLALRLGCMAVCWTAAATTTTDYAIASLSVSALMIAFLGWCATLWQATQGRNLRLER